MKTFKEFIMECQYFQYSQESYDMDKLCSEITLMEKYIDSQRFLVENGSELVLTEGYFLESVGPNAIQTLEEKFQAKLQLFEESVKSRLKSIWKAIKNFFLKLIGKKKSNNEKKKKIDVIISKISPEHREKLVTDLKAAATKTNFTPYKTQKGKPKIDLKDPLANNLLVAALSSDSGVRVDVTGIDSTTVEDTTVGVVDAFSLVNAIKGLTSANVPAVAGAISSLSKSHSSIKSKGYVEIHPNIKKLEEAVETIGKYEDRGGYDMDHFSAEVTNNINRLHKVVLACIPKTMQVYNSYLLFESAVFDIMVAIPLKKKLDDKAKTADTATATSTEAKTESAFMGLIDIVLENTIPKHHDDIIDTIYEEATNFDESDPELFEEGGKKDKFLKTVKKTTDKLEGEDKEQAEEFYKDIKKQAKKDPKEFKQTFTKGVPKDKIKKHAKRWTKVMADD